MSYDITCYIEGCQIAKIECKVKSIFGNNIKYSATYLISTVI